MRITVKTFRRSLSRYENRPIPVSFLIVPHILRKASDKDRLSCELRGMSEDLLRQIPATSGEEMLLLEAESPPPHKMDENLWKNREHIEEMLCLLERSHWPRLFQEQSTPEDLETANVLGELHVKLLNTLKVLESFQAKNADNIFNTVMSYMPQDFRGTLIRQQRDRSERNRQTEVDALMSSGGSIRERYALLWRQQMERRRQLAQLGSAAGVYKTLVKYLVGVPQVLLDFIKQINDDQGPMEEQRQRYGPSLYSLTSMVLLIRLFFHLSWGRYETKKLEKGTLAILERAINLYTAEFERFLKFIGEVFANSPFFISAEDAGGAELRKKDDYKEAVIPAGNTFEVSLTVDSVNSYIAWDFSLVQGKMTLDIGFRMEYLNPSGEITLILPYRRYESSQGNFCACMTGRYKLIWDNTYSTFFRKSILYKVDCIPPVADIPQSTAGAP
ncbi:hypothetical protein H6P81_014735 [Aristolochia fimbriata]|uniref:GOLD domain-containing protein n=1 Tax=Aristolochia fimbriata TaxID=158543 RepID=A0AAV7E5J4_ARIFI|nr:hypothetical protein H6P81_014735 [Aristolochia fimbriata]